MERAGLDNPLLERIRARGGGGTVSSAGRLAPLGYEDEQLRRAFDQLNRGETAVLESRGFTSATGQIPPDLGPILPVFPKHENRLLNRLPGIAITVPAIAYIQVDTVSGNAAIVGEAELMKKVVNVESRASPVLVSAGTTTASKSAK